MEKVAIYNLEQSGKKTYLFVKNEVEINSERMICPEIIVSELNRLFRASLLSEEHLWCVALSASMQIIGFFELSHGGTSFSYLGNKEIYTRLFLCGASYFFLAHNHPGKSLTPSAEDLVSTKKVYEAGELLGIRLLDHFIIGEDGYFSFAENNFLKKETQKR